MAIPQRVKMTRSQTLVRDYAKRFKSKVPLSVLRAGRFEQKIEDALSKGSPVKEWEDELVAARKAPAGARSLQQEIDSQPLP